jgi:hypothetical protein
VAMWFVESPRLRRRLAKLAVVAVACLVAALVVVLIPSTNGRLKSTFSNEPAQRVIVEREVPVTPARRAEVNALFDTFVPNALERRDPARAYDLVTPNFRGTATRASWREGKVPVFPYDPRGRTFHGWTVETSYRDSMSVELYLQPRNPKDGPVAYSVELRRLHGRWLIDAFYPRTSYAPAVAAGRAKTEGKTEKPTGSALPQAKGGLMWILIIVFLSLIVGMPLVFFTVQGLRSRRSRRRIAADLERG